MAPVSSNSKAPSAAANGSPLRRDRPWLLPYSRKLRNVASISLRNLSLSRASDSTRQRGKTIDDDALPTTLVSPAKLVALREQKALGHSRSSSDLRRVPEETDSTAIATSPRDVEVDSDTAHSNGSPAGKGRVRDGTVTTPTVPKRPMARMRRRSTLEWANATPAARQEKLEGVTGERMADVFFSLHITGVEEPVYISETVVHTMNPTFRSLDLSRCSNAITRLDHCLLRFWAKSSKWQQSWRQLLEIEIDLRALHYLGKNLETFHYPLPRNAVIFHLTDGVYTAFTNLSEFAPPSFAPSAPAARTNSLRTLPTSSFDALLRLAKLDDSIQDALATRDKISSELETLLESNRDALAKRDHVLEAEDRLKTIDYAKRTVDNQLAKARRQQREKQESIHTRRDLMATDKQTRATTLTVMKPQRANIPHLIEGNEHCRKLILAQRRRVCEDLLKCYPITSIEGKSLGFTIRGLYLPNADEIDSIAPDQLAAALGHTSHVLQTLSFYLDSPLQYPVNPRGSTSTIFDPISLLPTKNTSKKPQTTRDEWLLRTYPLFTRSVPRFKTEYALFLLNKNIQLLLESCFGVRVLDIRHTLANMKYLFYVATAGEGELPARKAGGVRGLMSTGSHISEAGATDGVGGGAMESLRKLSVRKGG